MRCSYERHTVTVVSDGPQGTFLVSYVQGLFGNKASRAVADKEDGARDRI